eukprot:TRINITY_DN3122_c0_g1_i1.p1 TRINITY_DN3122_c0_g1~~TRINITY_DN3122_c0_g1_i1.p1  ORF type:complete len:278 (-),score=54.42 TRINITY_DN3122_c0_g1_i1:97-930(-)
MLTLKLQRSSGSVYLDGKNIDTIDESTFKDIGLCPQANPLWDDLTVDEHLYIFARIKGLNSEERTDQIHFFKTQLSLNKYSNKKAGNLSGGNKRKLCVAISLLGGTKIAFYDEPSSGMDPLSRKRLRDVIIQVSKQRQSAIILTTHSMAEAESMCDRIGILVRGRLRCIGTMQHLREKYGKGYHIQIKREATTTNEIVDEAVMREFKDAKIIQSEAQSSTRLYSIPTTQFVFSNAFAYLIKLKNDKLIEDFSVQQSTLEQIFIYLSQEQRFDNIPFA